MKIAASLPLLPLVIAACTPQTGGFPSLAKRPVEAMNFRDPPAAPEQPLTADPALDGRIAAFEARLKAVAAGFDADAAKAGRLSRAAGARTVGSDAWLEAQSALATLDDWRAQATGLAAEIEAAGSARAATLAPPYPPLEALEQRSAAEAKRQDDALRRLQDALPAG